MPRTLRLKVAREYLDALEETGERKKALMIVSKAYWISHRSIDRYVAELRRKH